MRIIFLSDPATAFLDVLAWLFFHLSIGYRCSRIPVDFFKPSRLFYKPRKWEKGGEVYQKLFHVKSWKGIIPAGANMYSDTFKLTHLPSLKLADLELWIKESCRAEFCHWIMMLPGFLFFLWNSVTVGWWMVAYAVANNIIPIIMQRYNRPRIQKLLDQLERKSRRKSEPAAVYEPQPAFSNSYQ
jgi:glycosyl-4,4'-diaponeurosporenoate acyltransferase